MSFGVDGIAEVVLGCDGFTLVAFGLEVIDEGQGLLGGGGQRACVRVWVWVSVMMASDEAETSRTRILCWVSVSPELPGQPRGP